MFCLETNEKVGLPLLSEERRSLDRLDRRKLWRRLVSPWSDPTFMNESDELMRMQDMKV